MSKVYIPLVKLKARCAAIHSTLHCRYVPVGFTKAYGGFGAHLHDREGTIEPWAAFTKSHYRLVKVLM